MTQNAALVILLALMAVGLIGWLGLGGLQESGKLKLPPGSVEFFDFMTKSTFGASMTVLTQALRRRNNGQGNSGATDGTPVKVSPQAPP